MPIERDQAADLLGALVSLVRAGRIIASRDARHSVSTTPMMLLRLLRGAEPRLGDLADQLRVQPSVASRAVAALESSGYVVRVRDLDDARACRVRITEAGSSHLAEREDHALRELARFLGDWSPADADLALEILGRLEGGVTQWASALDHSVPDRANPDQSNPDETNTDQNQPDQTDPNQTDPNQTDPDRNKEMSAA